jgi:hypothetical protein
MDSGTHTSSRITSARSFRNRVRFRGVEASYAFIEQPQTNGVAERFFKSLKEQIVYSRIHRAVAEGREAVEILVGFGFSALPCLGNGC